MVNTLPANAGDARDTWIPESERSPGVGIGNLLQYSCLENSLDRGTWWATYSSRGCKRVRHDCVHSCMHGDQRKIRICYKEEVEKAMSPHSSTLAWKIPWVEEPGGLQSMGSLRVRHDWATSLSLFTFMHWRRKWQPTPVFLPGESQGWGSLVGCRLWGHTESDTTELT